MVLVAQINKEHDTLELVLDANGLSLLRNILNKKWQEPIKNDNGLYDIDHEHLQSKEWGGNELTPEYTREGFTHIDSIKIVYLGKEGKQLIT